MAVQAGAGRVHNGRVTRQLSEYKTAIQRLQYLATLNRLKWRMLEQAILASGHNPDKHKDCALCTELRRSRKI